VDNATETLSSMTGPMSLFVRRAYSGASGSRPLGTSQYDGTADWRCQSNHVCASPKPPFMDPINEVFAAVRFLHLLRTCINKMVNWHDPVLLMNDYSAFRGLCVGQYLHSQSPSCVHQTEPCHWWYLHVCPSSLAGIPALISNCNNIQLGNYVHGWL